MLMKLQRNSFYIATDIINEQNGEIFKFHKYFLKSLHVFDI